MTNTGLGPHGERSSPHSLIHMSDDHLAEARRRAMRVTVALHTESEWANLLVSGIRHAVNMCGARLEVAGGGEFLTATEQIKQISDVMADPPDAVISLPIANLDVAAAHAEITRAGTTLVLVDNAPTSLLPGRDYCTMVSADNFQLGIIAAEGLAPYVPVGATVGMLMPMVIEFAFQQREIGFTTWMRKYRPDVTLVLRKFPAIKAAGDTLRQMIATDKPGGVFVLWADPAAAALTALIDMESELPVATVDLNMATANALARGSSVVSVAAQQPFQQGMAAAQAAILGRLGVPMPGWVAFPGIAVTRDNLKEMYTPILQAPLPEEIRLILREPAMVHRA